MATQRKLKRPMTRYEIECAAVHVGITRNEIWKVKSADVLKLISERICKAGHK